METHLEHFAACLCLRTCSWMRNLELIQFDQFHSSFIQFTISVRLGNVFSSL